MTEQFECNLCGSGEVYQLHTQYYKMNEGWNELRHCDPHPASEAIYPTAIFICDDCDGENVRPVENCINQVDEGGE